MSRLSNASYEYQFSDACTAAALHKHFGVVLQIVISNETATEHDLLEGLSHRKPNNFLN
jgi:hypothetical protein